MSAKKIFTAVSLGALAFAFAAPAATVTGSISVSGTKVKTEGAKSQKDVIVYLIPASGEVPPAPEEHAVIDQENLVFIPHVLAIQQGTTVDFLNNDTTEHNVFCVDECCKLVEDLQAKKPKYLDLGVFAGGKKDSYTFTIPGEGVMLCKLHPEMSAYVIVLETSYFTTAEIDGSTQSASYSIENVPPGEYVLKAWNKRCEAAETTITIGTDDMQADVELEPKSKKRKRKKK